MKYYTLLTVFIFLVTHSLNAQSLLDLQNSNAQIESFNSNNQSSGNGKLRLEQEGVVKSTGTLRDYEGQSMTYNSHYTFKSSSKGLQLSLSFYLNSFMYSPGLEISYDGDVVSFPAGITLDSKLPEVSGVFSFFSNGKPLATEKAKLTHRKILKKESIEFRNSHRSAYVISGIYEAERVSNNVTTKSIEEITEWYIEGVGVIQSERKGLGEQVMFKLK